ncbi:uncharacterized protein ACA1_057510 [Acanthamoeba castellanii str. Neff]|uniref:THH1/TOM1/TOM3 domain-containing protein n=1 Tax=Acanthamoeba castellanii (strain ATCC 30010 / Neff) TaxID=1257118 RepID=L8GVV2_ACACF|nr:uncharacterized protein ACA1_057510 [Acanthamoeba castellanii str. Neff]ELR17115.1 hypothetical protein ACA1_057510 [Acanthamoeba castellanii str. Neff]
MDFQVDMRYDITHFVLAGLYFFLCLLSIFCMLRLCVVGHFKRWQLFFHPIFFLGTLVRMVFFLLQPLVMEREIHIPNKANMFMNSLPSWFFFTDYLIVLFLWAEIYHFARGGELTIKKLSPVFWSLTITMYCAVILLYVFDATLMQSEDTSFSKAGNPVEETLLIVDAAIFICSSLAFMIYGTAIYLRLVHSVPTANRRSLLRRIQIMTTMISFGFCCRAVIILLNVFVFPDMSERWWFDLAYFTALEWFPLLVMLGILHKASNTKKTIRTVQPVNATKRSVQHGYGSSYSNSNRTSSSDNEHAGLLNP